LIRSDQGKGGRRKSLALLILAMPTVIIPALLRKFTGGIERVSIPGKSIRELVRQLGEQFQESTSSYWKTETSGHRSPFRSTARLPPAAFSTPLTKTAKCISSPRSAVAKAERSERALENQKSSHPDCYCNTRALV